MAVGGVRNMELSKKDWTLFRKRLPQWQEAYMDRLNREYIDLLQGSSSASEKFRALDKRIRRDRKSPGVVLEVSKDNAIFDIAEMLYTGVIAEKDMEGFSEDVIEAVKLINEKLDAASEYALASAFSWIYMLVVLLFVGIVVLLVNKLIIYQD